MLASKILVVEDEVITSEVIKEQLEQLGYLVTDTVTSGNAAIANVAKNPPDLVLMDIVLKKGDIDGITAATRIREQFRVPVVYLTAHSDQATLDRAKITEPSGYIVKPFNERDLRVAIEIALEKHRMGWELAEREELLSAILRSTKDAIFATNKTGAIAFMNPAAESLTGWSLTEADGQIVTKVAPLVHEIIGDSLEHPAMRVLQEGQVIYQGDRIALVAKDSTQIPVGTIASPIIHQHTREINGAVLVLWDLSDRRQIQALETEVVQYQQSEAEARQILAAERELSKLKTCLISTISHEFGTSLMILQTATELLRLYDFNLMAQRKDKYLNQIQAAVKQMAKIINDILIFSRVDAGKVLLQPKPLHIESFCQELIEEQQLIANSDYIINFSYQGSREEVSLDEKLLLLILINLLNNAIKYSPKGGTISLLVSREDKQLIFQVQDQGIGIPLEEQQKLFETFFRGSNVGTIRGTGMGLAIVKKFVELHSGQISVSSEVGVGTTFTVSLPICQVLN